MSVQICLFLCSLLSKYVDSTNVDQRQTGELNVQVDLKDVQIIALLGRGKEDYVNYDYAYDYSELTVKPPKPLNTTSTTAPANESTTMVTTFLTTTEDSSNDIQTTTKQSPISEETTTLKSHNEHAIETITPSFTNITVSSTTTELPNCKKGFTLNNKGECQLKLNGTENALLKLVKLSQRLKLRRENKSDD